MQPPSAAQTSRCPHSPIRRAGLTTGWSVERPWQSCPGSTGSRTWTAPACLGPGADWGPPQPLVASREGGGPVPPLGRGRHTRPWAMSGEGGTPARPPAGGCAGTGIGCPLLHPQHALLEHTRAGEGMLQQRMLWHTRAGEGMLQQRMLWHPQLPHSLPDPSAPDTWRSGRAWRRLWHMTPS